MLLRRLIVVVVDLVTATEVDGGMKGASLGDLKHQVEKGTVLTASDRAEGLNSITGATIDFTSMPDGKQKAQHLLYRFLVELPEPLVPADAVQALLAAKGSPSILSVDASDHFTRNLTSLQ